MLKLKVFKPNLYKIQIKENKKYKLKANSVFPNIVSNGLNASVVNKTLIISGSVQESELVL